MSSINEQVNNETSSEEKIVSSGEVPIRLKSKEGELQTLINKVITSWDTRIATLKQGLQAKEVGAHAFELKKVEGVTTLFMPSNFYTLAEANDLFAIMFKTCLICNYDIAIMPEGEFDGTISDSADAREYISGLMLSLEENTISKTNFSSTSYVEQGRLEGQFRRALTVCSNLHIPFKWSKYARYDGISSNDTNDTLFKRIQPMIHHRELSTKIALLFVKLFTRAQNALASTITNINPSKLCLSFDEAWSMTGDIQKDKSGRPKRSKSGEIKRYHPSLPNFNGMDKTEVIYCKNILSPIWDQVTDIRNSWDTCTKDPGMYNLYIKSLGALYKAQVKAVKQVKAYVDKRVRELGLPSTSPKTVIMGRIAQRKGLNTYEPCLTEEVVHNIRNQVFSEINSEYTSINKQCCDLLATLHFKAFYDEKTKKAIPQKQYALYNYAKLKVPFN